MNLFKKILALGMALCMLGLLAACGDNGSESPDPSGKPAGDPTYKVTVTDFAGTPVFEGVVVCFNQNGQQVAMQTVNSDGVAEKQLPKGEYTVSLMFTDSNAQYFYEEGAVSEANPSVSLQLARIAGGETMTLVKDNQSYEAYSLDVGCTKVPLTVGARSYFLFEPTQAGKYEFSLTDNALAIGYYGMPHYIQDHSAVEVINNKVVIDVTASQISTNGTGSASLVIGVDSAAAESCILSVRRLGDAERTIEDEPWTYYETTAKLARYTLPADAKLREFDLTAKYNLVYNEADGFYHLDSADGPLVLVRLGMVTDDDIIYLDSFETILEYSGVCKYFFNEKGEFVKKVAYEQCLLEYLAEDKNGKKIYFDENTGLYPLTEDLKHIIQSRGEYAGWFDASRPYLYLFKDENGNLIPGIDPETSWLLMCCYIAK